MTASQLELLGKRFDFRRQERFAARDDDIFGWVFLNFIQDI
jgi:hypothetical protein